MAKLIPEVRVDKNGRSVVRHVRPDGDTPSKAKKNLPSPSTGKNSAPVPSAREVLLLMAKVGIGKPGNKTVRYWIEGSSPHQLMMLHEALSTVGTALPRERQIIERAFSFGMSTSGRNIIYEKIALRSAFSGEWKYDSVPPLVDTNSCIYAARIALNGDPETPIDLEDDDVRQKAEGFIRFVYEARYHFSKTDYPLLYQVAVGGNQVEKFVMDDFNSLVLDYSDRVHELLALIDDRKTSNAHLIREVLEHDGPSAVLSGYL